MKYLPAYLMNQQIKAVKSRGVFRTQENIYDEAYFQLTTYYFLQKNSIIDGRLGLKETPENNEIFKTKPKWNKSFSLLQRVAFLVLKLCQFILKKRS